MHVRELRLLEAGDRLPGLQLPAAPEGKPRTFPRASRDALVLLLLPKQYGAWRDYLRALADAAAEIEQWYASILVVISGELEVARALQEQTQNKLAVLADAEREAHRRIGVNAAHAGLLIVDRYGQIYDVIEAELPEELPGPDEIEEWTKYLATQCPECGVIDEPGYGEWALS